MLRPPNHAFLLAKKKKLANSVFTSFSWGMDEFFTGKLIHRRQKEIVNTSCQICTIGWMHENLPIKLPELLTSPYRCVWLVVVLMKHISFPKAQICLLLNYGFHQVVQLLTVRIKIWIESKQLLVDDFLPVPPRFVSAHSDLTTIDYSFC